MRQWRKPPAAQLPRRATYWTDFTHAHLTGSDPHSVYYNKHRQRELIEAAGYPTVRLITTATSATEDMLDALPDAFVLKVPHKSSTRGVIPVWRDGAGFVNAFSGVTLSAAELCDEINAHLHETRPEVLVEEFFEGEEGPGRIPHDYKFHVFESGVEFVARVDRNIEPRGLVLIDAGGQPLPTERAALTRRHSSAIAPTLPANAEAMFAAAVALRRHCDLPMVSVDMYSDGRRFVVGELTPTPGAMYYGNFIRMSEAEDLRLGSIVRRTYRRRRWRLPRITENPPAVSRRHRPDPPADTLR